MPTTPPDPTTRFSSRVDDYIRYRPTYPTQLIIDLHQAGQLPKDQPIIDVGSGTGIFSELLLQQNYTVTAIEPNDEMRHAAEHRLSTFNNFTSLPGSAQNTTLPNHSASAIVAAQAFHWFDPIPTRKEWLRILKPAAYVTLIWNDRRTQSTPFLQAYEQLLQDFATDYNQVNHTRIDLPTMQSFFSHDQIQARVYDNHQHFDFESLAGRLLSSSYAPDASHPNHLPMMRRLREIFDTHQQNNTITFHYDTRAYTAQFSTTPQ